MSKKLSASSAEPFPSPAAVELAALFPSRTRHHVVEERALRFAEALLIAKSTTITPLQLPKVAFEYAEAFVAFAETKREATE